MGVESSLSISLICNGKLWGLIACHNNTPRKVSLFTQRFCAIMSRFTSKLLEVLSYEKRIYNRSFITEQVIDTMSVAKHVNGYIVADSGDLLSLFRAGIAFIC